MFNFLHVCWNHMKIRKTCHNQVFLKARNFQNILNTISHNKSLDYFAKCQQLLKTHIKSKKKLMSHVEPKHENKILKDPSNNQTSNQLSADLVDWAISCKISHYNFSILLKVLKKNGLNDLPKTSKSLFENEEKQLITCNVTPGVYVHYGLTNKLKQVIEVLSEQNLLHEKNIDLTIFIDNVQLNKDVNDKLWIILASVTGYSNLIFTVGAYSGVKNPESSNLFLNCFVNEIKHLCKNGLEIQNTRYGIKVKNIICDAPAKAFVLNTKMNYLSYGGCTKCNAEGVSIKGKVCFPKKSSPKRDKDFRDIQVYKNEKTKLLEIPKFGVVTNIPLDYMHLVCLGVVKKLISIWSTQPILLEEIKQDPPKEFQNNIKPFKYYSFWKSSQFRQFLLYYGPVLMKGVLSEDKYKHFLKLHLACRMLCQSKNDKRLYSMADAMLNEFVQDYVALYGSEFVTHNLHGLYHLTDDCRRHGTLDEFSAFPFEMYLLRLKSSVTAKKKIRFLQVVLQKSQEKLFEKSLAKLRTNRRLLRKSIKIDGSMPDKWKMYERLNLKNWNVIRGQKGDEYVMLKDRQLVRVLSIWEKVRTKEKSVYLQGVQLHSVTDLYDEPVKSSQVGVFLVGEEESEPKLWPIDEIDRKCLEVSMNGGKRVLCSMMDQEF